MENSNYYRFGTEEHIFEKGYQSKSINYLIGNTRSKHLNIHFSGYELSDLQLRKEGFDLIIKTNDSDEIITEIMPKIPAVMRS